MSITRGRKVKRFIIPIILKVVNRGSYPMVFVIGLLIRLGLIHRNIFHYILSGVPPAVLWAPLNQYLYNPKTGKGDRLQDSDFLNGRSFGEDRANFYSSLIGRLLVLRKEIPWVGERKEKADKLICVARSWHFFRPLTNLLEQHYPLELRDLNEIDPISPGKNASKIFRARAFDGIINSFLASDFSKNQDGSVILVDWLNHSTLHVLERATPADKIIVRVHSYEVFSYFAAVIDYRKIHCLVFISEGIRKAFLDLWGRLLPQSCQTLVVQNVRTKKLGAACTAPKKKFDVLMVQYADMVKGLDFALQLVGLLREAGLPMRLILAGAPPSPGSDASRRIELYREVNGHGSAVELGYLDDLSRVYEESTFILSASVREGSHESVVEAINHACIPLIRNWPLLRRYDGAKNSFPMFNNYDTPEEMCEYVLALFENDNLSSEAARSKECSAGFWDTSSIVDAYRRVIDG